MVATQPATPVRAFECTEDELVEHVARYAAENGNTELESLCDDVLAGLQDEEIVLSAVRNDDDLAVEVQRGLILGWRVRP